MESKIADKIAKIQKFDTNYFDRFLKIIQRQQIASSDESIQYFKKNKQSVCIPKRFNYRVIKYTVNKKIHLTIKNILVSGDVSDSHYIIYFFKDYAVFVNAISPAHKYGSSALCTLNYDDINYPIWSVVDLKKQKIYFNQPYLNNEPRMRFVKKYLTTNRKVYENYLAAITAPPQTMFTICERCHLGHNILENYQSLDLYLSKIDNFNKNILLPYHSTYFLNSKHWKDIFSNVYVIDQQRQIYEQQPIFIRNTLHTVQKFQTYNFLKNIKNFKNINNKDQIVIVCKYDFRYSLNQKELVKRTIDYFRHKKFKKFALVSWYTHLQPSVPQQKFQCEDVHRELIQDLKTTYSDVSIIDTVNSDLVTLTEQIFNSFCYIAPVGSMQNVIATLANCKGLVLGGGEHGEGYAWCYNVLFIPTKFYKFVDAAMSYKVPAWSYMRINYFIHPSIYTQHLEKLYYYALQKK